MSNQPTQTNAAAICFHLSLNVSDLVTSIEFFTAFFGIRPAKVREDYAKFEIEEPPVVLSLELRRPGSGGVLNHVGLRMPNAESLVKMQARLELLGIKTTREEGIECCYSKQTKFWLFDPDGTLWEVYTLDGDSEHHECAIGSQAVAINAAPERVQASASPPTTTAKPAAAAIWSHRLGQPFPSRLFVEPETVDEIRLEGTFNMTCTAAQRATLLQACFAALRPGGVLQAHQLTSNCEIKSSIPQFGGAATVVEAVRPVHDLCDELETAGFVHLHFTKYDAEPCFRDGAVEFRETLVKSTKPLETTNSAKGFQVFYLGPAKEITLDDGTVIRRGRLASVSAAVVDSTPFRTLNCVVKNQF